MFKVSISSPGVARYLLFRSTDEKFPLFDKNSEDIFRMVQANVFGGPAQVFTRLHKVGETSIRGNVDKQCRNILGYDANALYPYALSQEFPTGCLVDRKKDNDFKPKPLHKHMDMYYWMDHVAYQQGIHIKHRLNNSNKEVRIGHYPVDGFCEQGDRGTVYEYNGCWYHPHDDCTLVQGPRSEKWQRIQEQRKLRTQKKKQYLQSLGYTVIDIQECVFKATVKRDIHNNVFNRYLPNFDTQPLSEKSLLSSVIAGDIFGMVLCDIKVPDQWQTDEERESLGLEPIRREVTPSEYFSELCPIFCTADVPYHRFGEHMQEHVQSAGLSRNPRRLLIGGMKGKNLLLATPLLTWYLKAGLVVTQVHRVIQATPNKCFKSFVDLASNARREGDADKSKAIIADIWKKIANSAYGSLLMNKAKHRSHVYVKGDHQMKLKVNDPRFRHLTHLDDDVFEVELAKTRITYNTCNLLGYFVLQLSKLHMLRFYYDWLDVHVPRSCFEMATMDTDSYYFAISGESLHDVVLPERKQAYLESIEGACHLDTIEADGTYWFPRTCCPPHALYDKRTPGLMKLEASGHLLICLAAKTYFLANDRGNKLSCKGANKSAVTNPQEQVLRVLNTKNSEYCTNRGIRELNGEMVTYELRKVAFSYFYCKREVLADGIHTRPLNIMLNPINLGQQTLIDYNSCLSIHYEEQHMYDDLSFNSLYHVFAYRQAQFHEQHELMDEIFGRTNHWSLREKVKSLENSIEWSEVRYCNMFALLLDRWLQSEMFRECLARANNFIVCGRDRYWCSGVPYNVAIYYKPGQYPGLNKLGDLLSRVKKMTQDVDFNECQDMLETVVEEDHEHVNALQRQTNNRQGPRLLIRQINKTDFSPYKSLPELFALATSRISEQNQ